MAIIYHQFHTEGLALISYLIGDSATGAAALIDPRPDVGVYLQAARKQGVTITHILETHIHADLMSGSRELAAQSPGAKIYVSGESDPDYEFEHETLHHGDTLELGQIRLIARHTPGHTPGHTPEHLSYEATQKDQPNQPWGVFSGDSLFVGSAGRPDLLGAEQSEKLADQLYTTLYDYYFQLSDGVLVMPAHGAGSPCGTDIGDRMTSTIGYEKQFNPFLQYEQRREEFMRFALDAPEEPAYYQRMKKLNLRGPNPTLGGPQVNGFNAKDFSQMVSDREQINLIDTRSFFAFGAGHIPGAVNIWAKPMLSVWAGWLLDPEKEIFLILDHDTSLERVTRLLLRIGLTRLGGYLVGGMDAWARAGLPLEEVPQMPVQQLQHRLEREHDSLQLLDVRSAAEFERGSIKGATHMFLPEIAARAAAELDASKMTIVYCGSGYRASIASSILKRVGFRDVRNLPGSWQAWVAR